MRHFRVQCPSFRTRLLATLAAAALLAEPALAADRRPLNIPAGRLEDALSALAAQTGDQLIFTPELVRGRQAPALTGAYDADDALQRLLAGSDIVAVRTGQRVLVLKPRAAAGAAQEAVREGAGARPFTAAAIPGADPQTGNDRGPGSRPASAADNSAPAPERTAPATVAEVEVTGSHIRGAGPPASPLVVLTSDDLRKLGRTTLAEALNTLPQVFSGQSTEGAGLTSSDTLGTNSSYATGVNLRGLGSNATLVLVNGRRLGGSGAAGEFADLSNIPAIAVSRVEILLDGASATYGSDAVGGVVNVILRRDLQGGEIRASAGVGSGGTPREGQVGVVFGHAWDSGNLLLAYEGYQRDALASGDRDFAASADFRAQGGSDRRLTTAFPGNITAVDPATRLTVPYWGIPPGQPGTGLQPSDFQAGVINRVSRQEGMDILPAQRRQGVYVVARQALTPQLEVSADARYGFRAARTRGLATTSTFTVSRANPYFVSPIGAASHQIQYSFAGELPNPIARATAESLSGSIGARLELPRRWAVDGYLGGAQEINESRSRGSVNTAILAEALGNVPDRPETAYQASRDGYFNPFTGVAANSDAVLAALATGFSTSRTRSQVVTANIQADGPLFALPGGDLKLALGANARRETFRRDGASYASTTAPRAISGIDGDRSVLAAFAELRAPLVGPENARPGLELLEVSGAVRAERFSDFGTSVDPRLGVVWSPLPDLRLRGSYGRSFRAPSLFQLLSEQTLTPTGFSLQGVLRTTLAFQGGNPDLQPETAVTWTAGFDWRPSWSPGSSLSLTWFDTDFKDRIGKPVTENLGGVLTDPRFTTFVRRISPATNPADLALVQELLALPIATAAAGAFPARDYFAIVELRSVNTGKLRVSGLDVQARHDLRAFGGELTLSADASRLFHYDQQLTPVAPAIDLAGVATYPAKLRGRLSADWRSGPWGGGASVNYIGAFHDLAGRRLDDQTSVDLRLRLAPREGPWASTAIDLTVRNLFDRDPPFYDTPFTYGFDGANADVVGRFVHVQLTRSW